MNNQAKEVKRKQIQGKEQNKEHCFIITPIGDNNDAIRRHIEGIIDASIRPALENKYEIVVAHRISEPGSITKQIIQEIYSSKLVIANLTNKNPNVMYELAFRHSLGAPVIMIAEHGTSLPSDVIMERTIFYDNDAKGALELREKLVAAEGAIDFDKISSPIYDLIREISKDEKIVKIAEEESTNQVDGEDNIIILKHILEKLNNLEDSVQAMRPLSRASEDSVFRRRRTFIFSYLESGDTDNIHDIYRKTQGMETHFSLRNIFIDEDKKIVRVAVILKEKMAEGVIRYIIIKFLEQNGFSGVSFVEEE